MPDIQVHCKYDELLPLPEIKERLDPKNRNTHPDSQIDDLIKQFTYQGVRHPIIISKRSGLVRAGHGRYLAAARAGMISYPVVYQDWKDGDQEYAFGVADNALAHQSTLDLAGINLDLADLGGQDFSIDLLGIQGFEIEPADKYGDKDADDVPTAPKEPSTKAGDIYSLGSHRLICGDATNFIHVLKVMCDEQAHMLWTDPPYNVDYVGKTKDALTIENDKMDDSAFREFLANAFTNAARITLHGGAMYIAHADSEGYNFRGAARDSGWLVKQCLIWKKNSLVMGRQDFHWIHEPILYGWKEGGPHKWLNDRKQVTVLEYDRPSRSTDHPTMKPVKLVEYCIANNTAKNEIVFDPFGGSGTTLIACEELGRQCRMMELDPIYCDVIIARWEKFTGQKATKV